MWHHGRSRKTKKTEKRFNINSKTGEATVLTALQEKIKRKIYGQVNRGILYSDDGDHSEFFNVDNDNSSTRMGFEGNASVTKELTLGSKIEVQFESNSTASVNQTSNNGVGTNTFTNRKLEIYGAGEHFGKINIGQGSTASDGTAEVDFSETAIIAYSAIQDMAAGFLFRNSQTGSLTSITIGNTYSQLDGLGRNARIRYDTPVLLGGYSLSTSFGTNDT